VAVELFEVETDASEVVIATSLHQNVHSVVFLENAFRVLSESICLLRKKPKRLLRQNITGSII